MDYGEAMASEGSPDVDPQPRAGRRASVTTTGRLDDEQQARLASLVASATDADGVPPLSEHALLHLRTDAGPAGRRVAARRTPAGW